MTKQELFTILKDKFREIVEENGFLEKEVKIECRALSPEEAIGNTKRKDFPILDGKEVLIQADVEGGIGQAFTDSAALYRGTIQEVLDMDIESNDYDRGIFIATLNAVMRKLELCDRSIHCKDDGPEDCACQMAEKLYETYGPVKITQIGYQPAILERISEKFQVRILDLNPANIGHVRYGVMVEDGAKDYEDAMDWADLILCTGSTLGNGTIVNFMDLDKDVLFYGTTAAGAAEILGLKRICYAQ